MKAGKLDRARSVADAAERVARAIGEPDDQAFALVRAAHTLVQVGVHKRARRLVASALSTGDWSRLPLDVLISIAPEVPATIGDWGYRVFSEATTRDHQ